MYYITFEVIHPREHELTGELQHANDMDQVMELHEKFLDSCLKECLLASQELLKILTKLMTTCLLFADHMARFMAEATSSSSSSSSTVLVATNAGPVPGSGSSGNLKATSSFRKGAAAAAASAGDVVSENLVKVAVKLQSILARRKARIQSQTDFIYREASHESFVRILNKFADTFDTQVSVIPTMLLSVHGVDGLDDVDCS